ncbi:DENN domain-containing protein 2B [Paramormyrops kingsleyae]|uniref:DENN domain containing 2B n=1 Tax=Paramormyrops kingsleyae TaxID=1676925 RepID=A0A3B3ST96_9TELE|nr:suppression of tumorigenicity 5 protein [Paramormyrops kingsleyae]XP_023678578.1 suppression of tumorigenicity 5 protein [Paramormyrops kingsleyae]
MTANKSAKAAAQAGESKVPREVPDRCQSASPPPILSKARAPAYPLSDSEDAREWSREDRVAENQPLRLRNWSNRTDSLRCVSLRSVNFQAQNRLLKARSVACLDNRLSIYRPASGQEQKENRQDGGPAKGGLSTGPRGWSTLSLGPTSQHHQRTLSLGRTSGCSLPVGVRRKISEWECRRVDLPRMSLCLDKRPIGERMGGSDACPSLLSSPCSDKTFDFKGVRRMSTAFSECSYPETEEEEPTSERGGSNGGSGKRPIRTDATGLLFRSISSRKENSAVLSRIQKIEQALKESPPPSLPCYPSSCYTPDKLRRKGEPQSGCSRERSGFRSITPEREATAVTSGQDRLPELKQRFSISSASSGSPELSPPDTLGGVQVNPLPKPKRTFEYEVNRNHESHKPTSSTNGLPPSSPSESPPPLPSTPAPPMTRVQKPEGSFRKKPHDRESCESEDASSLPPSPAENGSGSTESRSRPSSKSTLEENAYEDIVESPYEDVVVKGRELRRKPRLQPESLRDTRHRTPAPEDGKVSTPSQVPSTQSPRLPVSVKDRKYRRATCPPKRQGQEGTSLVTQSTVQTSPCGVLEDGLSGDTLACHHHRRVPKLVQRINSIYCTKRGRKRLKKLTLSGIEAPSLREDNSESESDSDDRFKAHTRRLLKLQSMLSQAPSYRTLELQLIEWQERELFEYFVVVSLKKKPTKNSYSPEVTYQFPKLDQPTKQMREAEQRLKAIPQFCFPDAKDWSPVSEYSSETFSFMLTGEDGSRRFGYCRRLLPSGKGPRLPEVYCVISRLGCFNLFSKILDEVEKRRSISAALVYPFMRSLMESPFPAPGKTIKVKTFLPGAGNEVMELRRPMDSRLEHVDLESLFSCLSVRQVIQVFASLLLERRVIFVADKLSTLSSCVHAVVALLYPFSWQHTFIPVLPSSMVDIVCCPTPFLVGILSSSLPKLKDLPVEEALTVDLRKDRFIRQMDDEATLLPRKLQAALEHALEQRKDLISQDSDSESDEECNSLNNVVSEAFIRFFLETIGHYSLFMTQNEQGERLFQREAFRKSVASKSVRRFLGVFMESQMFAGFIQDRELRKCRAKGLFEQRVEQYLEELPDTEQSGVNKFFKELGSKMKFLHKKN